MNTIQIVDIHLVGIIKWGRGVAQSMWWLSYGLDDRNSIPDRNRRFFLR